MEIEVRVHERVMKRYPELTETDVVHAWRNAFVEQERCSEEADKRIYLALGTDARGRVIEMIAFATDAQSLTVYHAKTPPTRPVLDGLGMGWKRWR